MFVNGRVLLSRESRVLNAVSISPCRYTDRDGVCPDLEVKARRRQPMEKAVTL